MLLSSDLRLLRFCRRKRLALVHGSAVPRSWDCVRSRTPLSAAVCFANAPHHEPVFTFLGSVLSRVSASVAGAKPDRIAVTRLRLEKERLIAVLTNSNRRLLVLLRNSRACFLLNSNRRLVLAILTVTSVHLSLRVFLRTASWIYCKIVKASESF